MAARKPGQVLAAQQVDSVLPPTDASIAAHVSSGNLDIGDASHIGCCGETGQIADNTAAQSDYSVGAGESLVRHGLEDIGVSRQIFRMFSRRKTIFEVW